MAKWRVVPGRFGGVACPGPSPVIFWQYFRLKYVSAMPLSDSRSPVGVQEVC